uniref:C-type lectin domain-containing protein n=2 Tax=Sus scrofa TaxID=9823 RepID=A0A8D1Z8I4_PIG
MTTPQRDHPYILNSVSAEIGHLTRAPSVKIRVLELCFICSVMAEEVTYATLKFPNHSKTNEPQDSHSLKRTDNHDRPELELEDKAETGTGSVEATAKVAESRAMRDYYKLFSSNTTASDMQLVLTEQVERNTTLDVNVPKNVSGQGFYSCSKLWIWHGNCCYYFSTELKTSNTSNSDCEKNHFSLMNTDDSENWNRTQLFFRCLPSPVSWMDLNFTLDNTNQTVEDVSNISMLTCLAPT